METPADEAEFNYQAWIDTYCYHCGRTFESIAIDGGSPGCICEDPDGHNISTLEYEAIRETENDNNL